MPWKGKTIADVQEVEVEAKAVGVARKVAAVKAGAPQNGARAGFRQAVIHGMFLAARRGHVVALQNLPEVAAALRPMETPVGSALVVAVFRLIVCRPIHDTILSLSFSFWVLPVPVPSTNPAPMRASSTAPVRTASSRPS